MQRVSRAAVTVGDEVVGAIGRGLAVLVGVEAGDGEADVAYVADKVVGLRVFEDGQGKLNRGLAEVGGSALVVSQFTLLGDCRQGRRPSFTGAAPPEVAEALYGAVLQRIAGAGIPVAAGRFRAEMAVELVNEGPVTLLLDSRRAF